MPRIVLCHSGSRLPAEVTVAARALSAKIVSGTPADAARLSADLLLIDIATEKTLPEEPADSILTLLLIDRHDPELSAAELPMWAHGLVRTTHLVADLDHALRLAAALAESPVRLLPTLVRTELCHRLPNDPTVAFVWTAELRREIQERLNAPPSVALRLSLTALEAVENAILRGNLEISAGLQAAGDAATVSALVATRRRQSPFRERSVWASCRLSPEEVRVVIRDEGHGFSRSPHWPQGDVAPPLGRGGLLFRAFDGAIRYNAEGNEITLQWPVCEPPVEPAVSGSIPVLSSP
jgi:hypothetical protein